MLDVEELDERGAGWLHVRLSDGRRIALPVEDLLAALDDLEENRAVLAADASTTLDVFPTAGGRRLLLLRHTDDAQSEIGEVPLTEAQWAAAMFEAWSRLADAAGESLVRRLAFRATAPRPPYVRAVLRRHEAITADIDP